MDKQTQNRYPHHIARALDAAAETCEAEAPECHQRALELAEAIVYYLGAVAVGQYSQALLAETVDADPTLNRSLRTLRRVLLGQWLLWAGRGLAAVPSGPVQGLGEWYTTEQGGDVAGAYGALSKAMREHLAYTGEYGPREEVSPRLLLEMADQYRIRLGKSQPGALSRDVQSATARALLAGLRALLQSTPFFAQYEMYAPSARKLLVGPTVTTPMPPITAPGDLAGAVTVLLYPPGEVPDYTKRPNLRAERMPLFPLDPLLVYLPCPQCDELRVAALSEVVGGVPSYRGLDPECGHTIQPPPGEE